MDYIYWTIRKTECQRIDASELWCWRRCLSVAWIARRSKQSILKEIILNVHWKDWCWSWNSNTLTTWYKELTHWKRPWSSETLKAGGEGDDKGRDGCMASPTKWTWVWANSHPYMTTGKTIALTRWTFVSKVMSLLFNVLSAAAAAAAAAKSL